MREFQAEAELRDGKVVITKCYSPSFCKRFRERSYLDPETNVIETLEAALWLAREQLSLRGESGWAAAVNLIVKAKVPLKIFITYVALRRRYPRVYRWVREDTLIAYGVEGDKKKIEVLVLEEGEEVLIEDVVKWSVAASKDDHDPIIAIVDRNGSVTFYEARAVTELA